ncbi:diaminopimelate decarboxylase [Monoraphidium neglectum]|uniref:Diaminopimelate decarboxylase n=1 Tax=Monoraphidium neglectum TaxID=145388 RepID=A0A0D2MJI8_9CHLO|nr:diaminopimelate decarboxylase [Monoraphidium neglectum]KIZ00782.1 diaminopimelate decarboxylase [Monoraphidium neglectum]|eukprot:XP_013899801.1 diaminopimelate decarboxylase [Monoraphidium neglectum]
MTATAGQPLKRLRGLQAAAHERRSAALAAAIHEGLLQEDVLDFTPTAILMDVDLIEATIAHLRHGAGYPEDTLHTVAVKANPVGGVLRIFLEAGMGAEVASLGELAQALHVGFPPDRIVFDSPAKTAAELEFALARGVPTNLDNFQELARAAALVAAHPEWLERPGGLAVGLRINPQVGSGSIAALSTGGAVSKFGLPLSECREELVAAFVAHPWLNMLHLHVGSQGLPTSLIVEGAAKVVLLRRRVPALFDPDRGVRLMTENGRSLLAKAGCVVSRVEYTKASGGRRIAVCHAGADLLMRACYMPETWGMRVRVCDSRGAPKEPRSSAGAGSGEDGGGGDVSGGDVSVGGLTGDGVELEIQDIAGPLCFQGDRLATAALLPRCEVGDWVMVLDAGAYTLSMASRYNSRSSPAVYGFSGGPSSGAASSGDAGVWAVKLRKLRGRETLQQVLDYWNIE